MAIMMIKMVSTVLAVLAYVVITGPEYEWKKKNCFISLLCTCFTWLPKLSQFLKGTVKKCLKQSRFFCFNLITYPDGEHVLLINEYKIQLTITGQTVFWAIIAMRIWIKGTR
jgi:hypothetical protein